MYSCLQDTKYSNPSHELRTLQRKNVELSSLVKKLDEKNQQLATRNTELVRDFGINFFELLLTILCVFILFSEL